MVWLKAQDTELADWLQREEILKLQIVGAISIFCVTFTFLEKMSLKTAQIFQWHKRRQTILFFTYILGFEVKYFCWLFLATERDPRTIFDLLKESSSKTLVQLRQKTTNLPKFSNIGTKKLQVHIS